MPAVPVWYERLGEIEEGVSALPCPVVDRSMIERLFGVGRRRAIQLMSAFGGWQSGRTFLVGREELAGRLRELAESPEALRERKRRRRVADEIGNLEAAWKSRRVLIKPEVAGREGIRWGDGVLEIRYGSEEELLARLWAVSQELAERSSVLL